MPDRGYPSHDVLEVIVASGRDVVMRDRRIAFHNPDLAPSAIRILHKTPRDDSDWSPSMTHVCEKPVNRLAA